MRILLALLIAATTVTAQADGIYRWVDENGVVHFGEQPPREAQVEVVKKPKSERYKKWQEEQGSLPSQDRQQVKPLVTQKPEQENQPELRQKELEQVAKAEVATRAKLCKAHQKDLSTLTTNTRIQAVDENGNRRKLGEDERQERIAKAREQIRENC
ncbi:DUF4124 domain-containing protein [Microbulbifer sp. OS29]|uniref:DUF4124 domain-containing protein n=1 Tax=Microbulbifer okhotskensis TaxID=2926617 RepID=A0A9X2ETC2_9GAMM|nr:DUF4124 domain-containing protein [Microbulbifer okhotskensis]MCO1335393.1 DUF4124 domain-containing protein [Microbulbifer okhotskensis]